MAEDLGKLLKMAREERGISLNDLQDSTKIQKRYIEAIENGRYDLLPGPFYTRAFIRNISDTLQLNTEQLLKQYEGSLPSANKEISEVVPRRKSKISRPTMIGKWVTTFLLVLFVVLIFSIVYYFAVQSFPPKDETNEQQKQIVVVDNLDKNESPNQNKVVTPPPEEEKEPEVPQPELTFVEKVDKTYYYTIANVETIELKLRAEGGRCWYQVEKGRGKGILKDQTLEEGAEAILNFEDLANIHLWLGFSRAMKIEVNGIALDTSEMADSSRIDITLGPLVKD